MDWMRSINFCNMSLISFISLSVSLRSSVSFSFRFRYVSADLLLGNSLRAIEAVFMSVSLRRNSFKSMRQIYGLNIVKEIFHFLFAIVK